MPQRPVDLTVDQRDLQRIGRALKSEADGKKLKRDLAKNFRGVMEPAKERAVSQLMSIGHAGLPSGDEPLRQAVKSKTKVQVRFSGRSTGVRVRVGRTPVRGFDMAGRRLNDRRGFRRQVWGRAWVRQHVTPIEWFDEPMRATKKDARKAAREAMQDMRDRIKRKAK